MLIKEQQQNFFDAFGFIIFRNTFSSKEMRRINKEFDGTMSMLRWNRRRESDGRLSRFFMDEETPFLASLGDDPRFADVATELLRRTVLCIHVAGNYYRDDTWWHSDNFDLDYSGVKFIAYLDQLNASNGALRIIPGSHRNPMWRQSKLTPLTREVFGVKPDGIPSYVFESNPGDVIAFQHSLWHASLNGGPSRRMLEVNYYADPVTRNELKSFLIQMQENHGPSAACGTQMYPQYWRAIKNRRHQRWIRRLRELKVLDTRY